MYTKIENVTEDFIDKDNVTVNHNKGKNPIDIYALDESGKQVELSDILYTDKNTVQIAFSEESSGTVFLLFQDLILQRGQTEFKISIDENDNVIATELS